MPDPKRSHSRRMQIRSSVINQGTLGQFMRAVDWVLEHHTDAGESIAEEADAVAKAAIYMLCVNYFGDDVIFTQESSKFLIVRKIDETDSFDLRKILNPPKESSLSQKEAAAAELKLRFEEEF